MRIVLDTSVLIAGLRSPTGASAECLRMALLGDVRLLMDYKLSCEYRDVAFRTQQLESSGKTRKEMEEYLSELESVALPVEVRFRHRPLSPDVTDDLVLDVAINGGADAIVTANLKHLLEPAKQFGLRVVKPGELLRIRREGGL